MKGAPEDKLQALAELSAEFGKDLDLDARISRALSCLSERFGYDHAMLLVPGDEAEHLVMLACHGYPGGVGAVVPFGQGVIGVCAERKRAMRLNNVRRELILVQATQERPTMVAEIPFPGISTVQSQLAAPAVVDDRLVAVLYAEDEAQGRYSAEDSHALQLVASLLAPALDAATDEGEPRIAVAVSGAPVSAAPLRVRYYAADDSVFFDDEYVIKSLPGRILYRLLKEQTETGRREFSKKELRLDASLRLPPVRDNLDTRLILLRRRLAERFPCVQLVPVARGRFRLAVDRPFQLQEAAAVYP